jgi:outer membrane protein assembly complex protein YaeT
MKLFENRIVSAAAALILVFSAVIFAQQDSIVSVDVEGNITISDTKILSVVQTRKGQVFSDEVLRADSENIASLEGVEYAYYNAQQAEGGVAVSFVVVEKKLVREISFFGNKKLKDAFLRKQVNLVKGDYLDTLEIARALSEIRNAYNKKGYYFSKVEMDKDALEEGRVIFRIQEAKPVKVGGVEFEGNSVFTDDELMDVVKLRKRKFLIFTVKLSEDRLDEEIDRILAVYRENGYLDVSCRAQTEFNDKLSKAVVVFVIDEGKEYTTESITVKGNEFFTTEQIFEKMKLAKGELFDVQKADYDQETIQNMYREVGFIEARVNMTRRYVEGDKIALEYDIEEGNRFRIGRIDITGNQTTHDKVVRRELDEADFKPGRWYNASAARGNGQGDLEKDVKRASLAESVLITPVDAGDDQKTAVVDVTEGQTGMVMFGAGVDSSNGVIGQIILEQRNFDITDWPESFEEFIRGQAFKGAGQRMRLSLEPGTEVTRYSIDFTDPYAWDKPLSLNVGSSKYERDRESYEEDRMKGYVGLTRRYSDGWALGLRFRAENVDIDPDTDAPIEVWDAEGGNNIFGTKVVAIKNNTDSRYLPTKGDSYEVNYEQVFGDYNFGVVTGIYRWYKTLSEDLARRKTVLATKLQASSIIGDAPVFEKFYAGGTGSLRGFDYRGVSPRGRGIVSGEYDDPIGSDWLMLANAEITVPLSSDTFNWLFFCDTGMVDDNEFRSAVGTGIEILLPQWFGPVPMRFELAAPITKDESDDTNVFSFSMGRLF